ncbi:hypothetical protein BN1184_BA_00340 [Pantoea ananatis]|nr:hypothetical protein BN1184_BA_00340 [Pantoea ananatis]
MLHIEIPLVSKSGRAIQTQRAEWTLKKSPLNLNLNLNLKMHFSPVSDISERTPKRITFSGVLSTPCLF